MIIDLILGLIEYFMTVGLAVFCGNGDLAAISGLLFAVFFLAGCFWAIYFAAKAFINGPFRRFLRKVLKPFLPELIK